MDAVSYSHADKQKQRIEKFIEQPDSTSGVVTVPKVIGAGENITIPAGRIAVLPNVQVDGTLNVEGEVFIPSGATLSRVVELDGNQTISDVKTFTSSPIVPTPTKTDRSDKVATTEFVQRNFNVAGSGIADFNTITNAGLYESVVQGTAPNGMGGNDYYYIVVYRLNSETLVQIAYPYSTGLQNKKVWTRTRYVNTWGDWNLVSGGAISQVTTLSNPTKNVGASWQKLIYSNEQISTASSVCRYVTGYGNFYVLNKGTYELTAQIYPTPPQNTNAKISMYLGLFDLGSDGTENTLIAVANQEFPSGQHPSVLLNRVVEVTTSQRYFTFKWYFLDGGGVTPDMTLQTSSVYTYANIKKI